MEFDHSLFEENVGYYRNRGIWLPGKRIENGRLTWTAKAVDAALNMDLNDSDVLFATYPKTGNVDPNFIPHKILNHNSRFTMVKNTPCVH